MNSPLRQLRHRALPLGLLLAAAGPARLPGQEAAPPPGEALAELRALLDTPISGAAKHEQKLLDSPQAVEVLTGDEIRQQGIYRLQDALKLMTSVDLLEDDTYASYIGIRGIMQEGQPRTVQILVDGVPLYNAELGTVDADNLPVPIDLIDKVEVVRGPSSTLYGANAVAGVIAITTRRAPAEWAGSVRVSRADHRTSRWSAQGGFARGSFGLTAGYTGASFGPSGTQTRNTTGQIRPLDRDASHQYSALLRPSWHFGRADFWLSAGKAEKSTWSPNYNANPPPQSSFPYERYEAETAQAGWRQAWSGKLSSELLLNRTRHRFHLGPAPTVAAQLGDPGFNGDYPFVDFANLQLAAQVNWDPAERLRLVAGADSRRYRSGVARFVGFPNENKESASGAFVSADWTALPRVTLSGGLRWENETLGGSRFSPRAVAVWSPSDSRSLRVGYYDSTRSPQLLESRVYFNNYFVDYCPPPYPPGSFCNYVFQILPNPDLKPERISSLEAGYRQALGALTADLTLFQMKFRDLITQENLKIKVVPPNTIYIPTQDQNSGSATDRGIELAVQWRAMKGLTLGADATWLDYRRDERKSSYSPGEPKFEFAYTPRHKVNLWGRISRGRFTGFAAFQRVGALTVESLQAGGITAFEPRGPINQWHANAAWALPKRFSVSGYVRNGAREFTPQGYGGPTRSTTFRHARREIGLTVSWRS